MAYIRDYLLILLYHLYLNYNTMYKFALWAAALIIAGSIAYANIKITNEVTKEETK